MKISHMSKEIMTECHPVCCLAGIIALYVVMCREIGARELCVDDEEPPEVGSNFCPCY